MQTYIYRSSRKDGLYIYLSEKDDFSKVASPIMRELGKPLFVMELMLGPDRRLAREDVHTVRRNLKELGYHVQLPPGEENWASWDNVKAGIKAGSQDGQT